MTDNEAIVQLNFDMEMIRFNPETGETLTLEQIKARNEDNYKTYLADEMAITALIEIQKYREIEMELREKYHANVDIKMLMQHFIETIFKGEKHEGFCILTNEDAEMWDAYRAIGTVEECKSAVERMKPMKPYYVQYDSQPNVGNWHCPACNGIILREYASAGCYHCLQSLDWSE